MAFPLAVCNFSQNQRPGKVAGVLHGGTRHEVRTSTMTGDGFFRRCLPFTAVRTTSTALARRLSGSFAGPVEHWPPLGQALNNMHPAID